MNFNKVDIEMWKRKEYFQHYFNNIPCTFSMTVDIEITNLVRMIKDNNIKFYPTIIYCISKIVNRYDEFKTSMDSDGNVGIYDIIYPSYTVFHKENETFSSLWTKYNSNFSKFYQMYQTDIKKYGEIEGIIAKQNEEGNIFNISCIPWVTFKGFNLNLDKGSNYLLPIFTIGKYYNENNKVLIPLAVQVHHSVCDGYHLCRFINDLQETVNNFKI